MTLAVLVCPADQKIRTSNVIGTILSYHITLCVHRYIPADLVSGRVKSGGGGEKHNQNYELNAAFLNLL
jgi:hypothetical protein